MGVPGQILMVDGDRLDGAAVLWYGNSSSPINVLHSVNSARYFQIPHNAPTGLYKVRLRNSWGESANEVTVNVAQLSSSPTEAFDRGWPEPRVEDISLHSFTERGGKIDLQLAISAANIDPDAVVEVRQDETTSSLSPVSSVFYSAITSEYFNHHNAQTFRYPVFHYGMLIASVPNQSYGSRLIVKITNRNGKLATYPYTVAANKTSIDSDNDGLPDDWELNGYKAPSGATINLASMGCKPYRKDILVEVDWMRSATPFGSIWTTIEQIFSNAPVLNPDGSRGISLHIDRGQDVGTNGPFTGGGTELTDYPTMDFCSNEEGPGFVRFNDLKKFDGDRRGIFHYCIFGNGRPWGSSGRGEIWGDDFMVTFAVDPETWNHRIAQIGTFVHEFGHNLGLYHGGLYNGIEDFHERYKPNQESSMNYRYQLKGVPTDPPGSVTHTYSQGMYKTINEKTIDERLGICDSNPMDMNEDGSISDGVQEMDVNRDRDMADIFANYDEWGGIRLNFRDGSGRGDDSVPCQDVIDTQPHPSCGRVEWSVSYVGRDTCANFRYKMENSANTYDGGTCTPPANCGESIQCIPSGKYAGFILCDGLRYFRRADTDTVRIPNDLAHIDSLQVAPGDTLKVRMIIMP
jgi:hypothetical protein